MDKRLGKHQVGTEEHEPQSHEYEDCAPLVVDVVVEVQLQIRRPRDDGGVGVGVDGGTIARHAATRRVRAS